jgi:hypothetical protein
MRGVGLDLFLPTGLLVLYNLIAGKYTFRRAWRFRGRENKDSQKKEVIHRKEKEKHRPKNRSKRN